MTLVNGRHYFGLIEYPPPLIFLGRSWDVWVNLLSSSSVCSCYHLQSSTQLQYPSHTVHTFCSIKGAVRFPQDFLLQEFSRLRNLAKSCQKSYPLQGFLVLTQDITTILEKSCPPCVNRTATNTCTVVPAWGLSTPETNSEANWCPHCAILVGPAKSKQTKPSKKFFEFGWITN